jgi:hypothetical protein
VRIRRLFWLGAAILFAIAALIAIAAVLRGDLGETEWRVLATCAIAFVTGSTALAGLACLERGLARPAGAGAIVLGLASFAVWAGAVWSGSDRSAFWKLAGVLAAWTVAALVSTTLTLIANARRVPVWIVRGTIGAACLAAVVGSVMIPAESGDGWQLLAVLVILTVLGYLVTPILQRFSAAGETQEAAERLLGTVAGVDVVAVRGDGRSVQIGERAVRVNSGERIVLRPRTR